MACGHRRGPLPLALYEGSGELPRPSLVMLFYQVRGSGSRHAVGKSRRNISDLMDIRPDYAHVEQGGPAGQVDPDEVTIGTVLVVQPGRRFPSAGWWWEGTSTLYLTASRGEPSQDVQPGEEIISGCIDLTGLLKVRTTKEFGESTVSKILDLVENASSGSPGRRPSSPALPRCIPLQCVSPPGSGPSAAPGADGGPGPGASLEDWIYRGLTFLVISCPCALVISIPLSFFP